MLVVAFALAGRIDVDLTTEPLGTGSDGEPVYLRDVWPTQEEIRDTIRDSLRPQMYEDRYAEVFEGDELWRALPLPEGDATLYAWDEDSTYIRNPPFFEGMTLDLDEPSDVRGARVLAILGDMTTTDHISPAGAIPKAEPAGRWLQDRGVKPWEFNTFGSRRGNHEVMMRGTFGNVRIRNLMLDGREGGYTRHIPTGEELSIYDASMKYQAAGTPLVILAGAEYGAGSSRDWAAKGTALLGVKAVIASSYERIHRSNLVGMGVLPLQFPEGKSAAEMGLDGSETLDLLGMGDGLAAGGTVKVVARKADGASRGIRRSPCGWTPRWISSTTGTAGSSTPFCGRWPGARCSPRGGWRTRCGGPAVCFRAPPQANAPPPEGSGGGALFMSCVETSYMASGGRATRSAVLPPPSSGGLRGRAGTHRGAQHFPEDDGGLQVLLPPRGHEPDEGGSGCSPSARPLAAEIHGPLHRPASVPDLPPGDVLQLAPRFVHRVRTSGKGRQRGRGRRRRLRKASRGRSRDRRPFHAGAHPFLVRIQPLHPAGRPARRGGLRPRLPPRFRSQAPWRQLPSGPTPTSRLPPLRSTPRIRGPPGPGSPAPSGPAPAP
jgi:hypothetical protein